MYEAEYRSKLMTPVAAVKNFGKGPESWDISEQLVVLEKWKSFLQCSLWSQFLPAMHLSDTAKLCVSA